jgi:hypothetical protein
VSGGPAPGLCQAAVGRVSDGEAGAGQAVWPLRLRQLAQQMRNAGAVPHTLYTATSARGVRFLTTAADTTFSVWPRATTKHRARVKPKHRPATVPRRSRRTRMHRSSSLFLSISRWCWGAELLSPCGNRTGVCTSLTRHGRPCTVTSSTWSMAVTRLQKEGAGERDHEVDHGLSLGAVRSRA